LRSVVVVSVGQGRSVSDPKIAANATTAPSRRSQCSDDGLRPDPLRRRDETYRAGRFAIPRPYRRNFRKETIRVPLAQRVDA
jgi:hypothetical protein